MLNETFSVILKHCGCFSNTMRQPLRVLFSLVQWSNVYWQKPPVKPSRLKRWAALTQIWSKRFSRYSASTICQKLGVLREQEMRDSSSPWKRRRWSRIMAAETPSFISISNYPQPDSRLLIALPLPLPCQLSCFYPQIVTENFEATHDNVRKEHLSKVLL